MQYVEERFDEIKRMVNVANITENEKKILYTIFINNHISINHMWALISLINGSAVDDG